MFKRDKGPSANIDTLISAPTRIQGDIQFSGGLHLDGAVAGSVKALPNLPSRLVISESGVVEGSVEAQFVEMNGKVRGDILAAARLTLGPKAQVEGNLTYGAIEMAAGARIQGKMKNTAGSKES
jgi:cytoskeletal protein CcmA (bactofilin family)